MALPYNPGTIGYGGVVITIATVDYIAESVTPNQPTQELRRYDELNAPNGLILTEDFDTGSATLQLATATTVLPTRGATFSEDLLRAGSTQTWVITSVSPTYEQGGIHKVSINFTKDPS